MQPSALAINRKEIASILWRIHSQYAPLFIRFTAACPRLAEARTFGGSNVEQGFYGAGDGGGDINGVVTHLRSE